MHAGAPSAAAVADEHAGHAVHTADAAAMAATDVAGADADDCVMGATCQGPVTALASLIWIPGVLTDTQAILIDPVNSLVPPAPDPAASYVRPINLPPPRA